MNDFFVDGIRSIAVANGVVRIELLQLRRGQSQTKLDPEVTAVLLLPVAALKDFSTQLAGTLELGFSVDNFTAALVGSVILAIVNALLGTLIPDEDEKD